MKVYFVLFTLLFITSVSKSAVITVTSNADAGAGSLREAIQIANSNGIIERDYIHFNIVAANAGGLSILLNSELPILTSNIVIDATTQPTALLGSPNIRISISRASTSYFSGLRLENTKDIEIYGIEFSNFYGDPSGAIEDQKGGVYLRNANHITIGSSAKPNCFNNSYAGILSPYIIPRIDIFNITIQGNIFGLSPNEQIYRPNQSSIDLSFLKNSVIGGHNAADGNIIAGSTKNGIALGGADGDIEIANNIIGLNRPMTTLYRNAGVGVYINGASSKPIISNNVICGQNKAIYLDYVNGGFVVQGNKIGVNNLSSITFGNEIGVHIKFCANGLIGGSTASSGNAIAYNVTPILIEIAYPITILRNSFYCNTKPIEYLNLPSGKSVSTSKISNITSTNINGVYLPNSKIELFYTDACADCQGKDWIATLLTDGSGNWSYNGVIDLSKSITSMGTNQDGATATFSKPLMNEAGATVTDVICNQETGSIKGIITFDASIFEWRNASDIIVGNAKDLENVGPGQYRLLARQNNSCSVVSQVYTINTSGTGISEINKQLSPAYCGQANGAIRGITTPNNVARIWYNANNTEVGRNPDLTNLVAGVYYFTAQLGTCNITSPSYTVENIEFSYQVATEEITPATCSQNNGVIKVLGFQGGRPDHLKWFNANDVEIGSADLIAGLAAGRYKLKGYSNFGCSYMIKEFVIQELPKPIVDQQNLKKYINCDGKLVSTNGIQISGQTAPYTYAWLDQNGAVIATTLNLKNVPLGRYILRVSDRFGCAVDGEVIDFTALEEAVLKVPNTFTPNGDAINDLWEIRGIENYPEAEINIYNRNGNRVFQSVGYSKAFDGTFNTKELPIGVYYYKINLKSECGVLTGTLTIIR